jgi:hypothetical protein
MKRACQTLSIIVLVFGTTALLGALLGLLSGLLVGVLTGNTLACVVGGVSGGAVALTVLVASMFAFVICVFDTERALF